MSTTIRGKIDKPKRPIGRPCRARPNLVNKTREGICDSPKNEHNIVEFEYDNPQAFKQLISSYFKKMNASVIVLVFKKDGMYIKCKGHFDSNTCYALIDVNYAIRYYCKKDYTVAISRSKLEDTFKVINNSPTNMGLIVTKEEQRERIHIIFQKFDPACRSDNSVEIQEYASVSQMFNNELPNPTSPNLDKYPLKFIMSYSTIKDHVGASNADILQISKYEDNPLTFKYVSKNKSTDAIDQFTDPKSISLHFDLTTKEEIVDDDIIDKLPRIKIHSDTSDEDDDSSSDDDNESDIDTSSSEEDSDSEDDNPKYVKIDIQISSISHIVKSNLGDKINFYIDEEGDLLTVVDTGIIVMDRHKVNTIRVHNYTNRL